MRRCRQRAAAGRAPTSRRGRFQEHQPRVQAPRWVDALDASCSPRVGGRRVAADLRHAEGGQRRRDLRAGTAIRPSPGSGTRRVLLQLDGVNVVTDPAMEHRASPLSWAGPRRLGRRVSPSSTFLGSTWSSSRTITTIISISRRSRDWPRRTIRCSWCRSDSRVVSRTTGSPSRGAGLVADARRTAACASSACLRSTSQPTDPVGSRPPSLVVVGRDRLEPPILLQRRHRLLRRVQRGRQSASALRSRRGPIGAYRPPRSCSSSTRLRSRPCKRPRICGAGCCSGIHWGTFDLADEPLDEPPRRMLAEASRRGIGYLSAPGSSRSGRPGAGKIRLEHAQPGADRRGRARHQRAARLPPGARRLRRGPLSAPASMPSSRCAPATRPRAPRPDASRASTDSTCAGGFARSPPRRRSRS